MANNEVKARLRAALTDAMKARDKVTADALRMVLTAVATAEVAGKSARELTDDEVVAVIVREVKQAEEAAAGFRAGGREESARNEDAQAAVLRGFLPQPLTGAELEQLVAAAVADATSQGLTGGRAMGRVMGALKVPTAGRADGGTVAEAVKRALGLAK